MDVYIPEEYVIQRRLEKKTASAATATNKISSTGKGSKVFRSDKKERKIGAGQPSKSSNYLVENNSGYICKTNSAAFGDNNVVFTYFSA